MSIIPVAEWRPDSPDLTESTTMLLNAMPLTESSYGPFPGISAYSSSAMDGQCKGAAGIQDNTLNSNIFAGTTDKLYTMTDASTSWSDVSIVGGYNCTGTECWKFAIYEPTQTVIATDFNDPIQSYVFGSSTAFANLSSGAPKARHICIAKAFAMVGNTHDGSDGNVPSRLWWSAANDPTNWPTPGSASAQSVQSDFNDIPGDQGAITGLASSLAGCDVAVFFARAIWRGFYVGPPDVFDFYPVDTVRGTPFVNGIVPVGNVVAYPSYDGFFEFDGSQSVPIGIEKVDRWFWANLNQANLQYVYGSYDIRNKVVLWAFPSQSAPNGLPDTLLGYKRDIQRWFTAQVSTEVLARFLTFGLTMDSMGAAGFTDVDTLPYTLDSAAWLGGSLQMGAINQSHQLAYFTGASLAARISTKAMQIFPGRRGFVQSGRPLIDNSTGVTMRISARTNYYDAEVFGPQVAPDVSGECPQRSDGRYHRALLHIQSGTPWTTCFGVDLTATPAGTR